jgi:O-acetylserine/cysteine efflux transporter
MPLRHLGLGVLVMIVWGINFSMIKIAERSFDPYLLATLRFLLCAFPAVFFLKRPVVAWRYIVAYGFVFGVLQFTLLFGGIKVGLSPGLASVALQLQVFFTIAFGALLLGERIASYQIAGIVLGFAGVVLIGDMSRATATVAGVLLVAGAAAAWGLANIVVKKAQVKNMLAFMVWSSLVPIVPLMLLTLWWSGPDSVVRSFETMRLDAVLAVLYLVYPTTLFGYAVWNSLLRLHRTSLVAPLTLLVPVFGLLGSMVIFDESLTAKVAVAAGLMLCGLALNQFGLPFRRRERPAAGPETLADTGVSARSP